MSVSAKELVSEIRTEFLRGCPTLNPVTLRLDQPERF